MKTASMLLFLPGLAVLGPLHDGNCATGQFSSATNYHCSEAIKILTYQYTNRQSTAGATEELVPGCVAGFGRAVSYRFWPDLNGQLVVDTIGSDFDTGLAVYTGSCDSLHLVACDDDGGGNLTSKITTSLIAGQMYYMLAGGYAGTTGNLAFHLTFTPTAPPASLGVQMQGAVAALTMSGSVKAVYDIEFATTLNGTTDWSVLTSLTLPQSPYLFHDYSSSNRPISFYRTRLLLQPLPAPRIGWVDYVQYTFGDYVSILQYGASFVFYNDVVIAILAADGAETHFTFGPTEMDPKIWTTP